MSHMFIVSNAILPHILFMSIDLEPSFLRERCDSKEGILEKCIHERVRSQSEWTNDNRSGVWINGRESWSCNFYWLCSIKGEVYCPRHRALRIRVVGLLSALPEAVLKAREGLSRKGFVSP